MVLVRPTGRGGVAALVALLVAATAACTLSPHRESPTAGGPVRFEGADSGYVSMSGMTAVAHDQVVFGATKIANSGTTPATLTSAELADGHATSGARLADVRVVDLSVGHHETIGAGPWPWADLAASSHELEGFSLPAGHRAELLLILDVRRAGHWRWDTTRLQYRSGGKAYRTEISHGFTVCEPSPASCPEAGE